MALIAETYPDFLRFFYACQYAGMVPVPLPAAWEDEEARIMGLAGTPDVLQIGTFGNPPQLRDVASLDIDDVDLKRLRECRVEECDVRLGADAIERIRREIADVEAQVSAQFL